MLQLYGLGLTYGTVRVVDHNPRWMDAGAELCTQVRDLLGSAATAVEHVGSTAVPGLAAKPILDIAVACSPPTTVAQLRAVLQPVGWLFRGDKGADGGILFVAETHPFVRTAHLHAVPHDGPAWRGYLRIRDLLRQNPDLVAAYADLKHQLARLHAGDRASYTRAKADFLAALT